MYSIFFRVNFCLEWKRMKASSHVAQGAYMTDYVSMMNNQNKQHPQISHESVDRWRRYPDIEIFTIYYQIFTVMGIGNGDAILLLVLMGSVQNTFEWISFKGMKVFLVLRSQHILIW